MIALFLKKKMKNPKTKGSSSKSKGKEKEGENSTSEDTESENLNNENLKSSSEEERISESGDNHSKRMSELEKHLEAIANRDNLQEAGQSGRTRPSGVLFPILPSLKLRPCRSLTAKVPRTSTYTISSPRP